MGRWPTVGNYEAIGTFLSDFGDAGYIKIPVKMEVFSSCKEKSNIILT